VQFASRLSATPWADARDEAPANISAETQTNIEMRRRQSNMCGTS
jgi:hypothetical protein